MSDDLLDQRWKLSSRAAASRVADEMVLLHLDSGTYFGIDQLGSRIWRGLKVEEDLRSLSAAIAADHGVGLSQVEADVRAFLRDLREHRLIDTV